MSQTARSSFAIALALAPALLARTAGAQSEPKFTFAKQDAQKPKAPPVEWKAQVKGGLIVTSGNSQTTNGTLGFTASRKEDGNRLSLEGGLAYGRSNVLTPVINDPVNAPTVVNDVTRQSVTTTNNWRALGRYDRFFTANNSGYASGQAAADKIAGKSFAGGGQIGYSRQLVKTDRHLLVAELGYDFSHERYVQQPMKTLDPVTIHSARVFVGETLTLTQSTGATASIEGFFNLNQEAKALNAGTGLPGVDAFHDTRVIGKIGFSTTLWKSLSAAVGFTLRYDQNPAPLPIPSSAPAGSAYAPGVQPFAEKVDTISEVTLIYTFL